MKTNHLSLSLIQPCASLWPSKLKKTKSTAFESSFSEVFSSKAKKEKRTKKKEENEKKKEEKPEKDLAHCENIQTSNRTWQEPNYIPEDSTYASPNLETNQILEKLVSRLQVADFANSKELRIEFGSGIFKGMRVILRKSADKLDCVFLTQGEEMKERINKTLPELLNLLNSKEIPINQIEVKDFYQNSSGEYKNKRGSFILENEKERKQAKKFRLKDFPSPPLEYLV
jgi:hypothetical protein